MSFLGDLFGMGGDPNAQKLQGFQQAGNSALGGIGNLSQYNTAGQVLPNIGALASQQANNPYAGAVQAGANAISPYGQQTGQSVAGQAGDYSQLAGAITPYANQILTTGFDPQNALYNRGAQQLTDQVRAGESARGIATSPYGAGLENSALSNYNIDWQNNQLGRQNQAIQGYGNAVQGGINAGQGALGLANGGQQTYMNAASAPYQSYNDIIKNATGAYNTYGQAGSSAAAIPSSQIGSWLDYVNAGNNANKNQIGEQAQNTSFFGNLLSGIGAIAGAF